MKTVLIGAVLVVVMALAGCVSTQEVGRSFNADARRQIKQATTTKAEIRQLFGEPFELEQSPGGKEMWRYQHFRVSADAGMFLPIPGLTGRGIEQSGSGPRRILTIWFEGDRVAQCSYEEHSAQNIAGTSPSRVLRDNCAE